MISTTFFLSVRRDTEEFDATFQHQKKSVSLLALTNEQGGAVVTGLQRGSQQSLLRCRFQMMDQRMLQYQSS